MKKLFPMQVGYRPWGQSGIEVSDWWPQVGGCIDEIALIRSVWTTDNDHGAQLQFHQGRHAFDGFFPSIGSWVHYGLGSLNENLPQFIVLGEPEGNGQIRSFQASYLGPQHNGVRLAVNPETPLPFASPGPEISTEEQAREFEFVNELNQLATVNYPTDPSILARIKSYELAFRMQMEIPKVFHFEEEKEPTRKLYGLGQENTKSFGQVLLTARRLVERGVRFIQVYHGDSYGRSRRPARAAGTAG